MHLGRREKVSGCHLVVTMLVASVGKLVTARQPINEAEDSPREAMQSRSLQDGNREYTYVPKCPDNYFDCTGGKAFFWTCGASCPGAFYTDVHCGCACQRSCAPPTTTTTPPHVTAKLTTQAPRTTTTAFLQHAVPPLDSSELVQSHEGAVPPAAGLEGTRAGSQTGVVLLAVICVGGFFLVCIVVIVYSSMLGGMGGKSDPPAPLKVHVSPPSHSPVVLKSQRAPALAWQAGKPSDGQRLQIPGHGVLHVSALQARDGHNASKSSQPFSSRTPDTRTPSAWSTTSSECSQNDVPSLGSEIGTQEIGTPPDAGVPHETDAWTAVVPIINTWVLPHQSVHPNHD